MSGVLVCQTPRLCMSFRNKIGSVLHRVLCRCSDGFLLECSLSFQCTLLGFVKSAGGGCITRKWNCAVIVLGTALMKVIESFCR